MLLPFFILIPFFGGLLCWKSDSYDKKFSNWVSLLTISLILILGIKIWSQIYFEDNQLIQNSNSSIWKMSFFFPWISRFNINFYFAIDGMSIIMIILSSILSLICILVTWNEEKHKKGIFYFYILWILSCINGIFLSIDLFLFFFFWEMILIPTYFLIYFWGYEKYSLKKRFSISIKYFIYSQISGFMLLISIIGLSIIYYQNNKVWTFNYEDFLQLKIPYKVEFFLMITFFLAFAIKIPIVFFHIWSPSTNNIAPISVNITSLLIKTSAYGLLRFVIPLFPSTSEKFSIIPICFGIINILYGALLAFGETNIKKIISYSSISHMGFVLLGIYSGNEIALKGTVIQILSQSFSTAGLFIVFNEIYKRFSTKNIFLMNGLLEKINWFPGFILFFSLANLGLPGTGNFWGELMILIGSFSKHPILIFIGTIGLVFSGIYSLYIIQNTCFGKINLNIYVYKNINFNEIFSLLILSSLVVLLGIFPQIILNTVDNTVNSIIRFY